MHKTIDPIYTNQFAYVYHMHNQTIELIYMRLFAYKD